MTQVGSEQWFNQRPRMSIYKKRTDDDLERQRSITGVARHSKTGDPLSPSSSISSTLITTPTSPTMNISHKSSLSIVESEQHLQRQSAPTAMARRDALDSDRERARSFSGTRRLSSSSGTTSPESSRSATPDADEMVSSVDLSHYTREELEERVKEANAQVASYERQLQEQDVLTQQMLAAHLADAEAERVKIRRLVQVVSMQDQLIGLLELSGLTPDSAHGHVYAELQRLKEDIFTIASDKQVIKQRISTLKGEIDMGQSQMNLMMMVSTEIQNAFDREKENLQAQVEVMTNELQRLSTQRSRDTLDQSQSVAQSDSNSVDVAPSHKERKTESLTPRLQNALAFSSASAPDVSAEAKSPLFTRRLRRSDTARFMSMSPLTPPPSEPLPPIRSARFAPDRDDAHFTPLPRSARPMISSTPPSPRRPPDRKDRLAHTLDNRPSLPALPSPRAYLYPEGWNSTSQPRLPPHNASTPLTSPSHMTFDGRTGDTEGSRHVNSWSSDISSPTTNDKFPFWKGMKKRWVVR